MTDWWIYRGVTDPQEAPHDGIQRLPVPPPWRQFADGGSVLATPAPASAADVRRATTYRPDPATVDRINAALYLRRPLLVTGKPGTGKSTMAYAVAHELGLGRVLRWPITSRVTLRDGLYQYDPLARLYRANHSDAPDDAEDVGHYIRLGPLGTALLPHDVPRVLLIDEIDKGDLDLPNDLLTIFEEGEYEIPELSRIGGADESVEVLTADRRQTFPVTGGHVRCSAFPFVVMTSNREREFPPAFLRRCIQLELREPTPEALADIVKAHLEDLSGRAGDLIQIFLDRRGEGNLATDQLLNAIYLTSRAGGEVSRAELANLVMSHLSETAADVDED